MHGTEPSSSNQMGTHLHVSGSFDGGNIEVLEIDGDHEVRLRIKADRNTDHRQWFYFRAVGQPETCHTFKLVNAGECDSPASWNEFRAVASYDRQHWFRVPTTFDGEMLTLRFTPEFSVTYYAQFAPYQQERYDDLLARVQTVPGVWIETLGTSVEGRPLDVIRVGAFDGEGDDVRSAFWITARQHPGEPMSAWCLEGLIERLLDPADCAAQRVRAAGDVYLVPNMNPDGTFHGHVRTNAAGIDLNRAWPDGNMRDSPEVHLVRQAMTRTGVAFYLDIHGDKELPYIFSVPSDGVPSITPLRISLRKRFERELLRAGVGYQSEHGYPPDEPGGADLHIGANFIAEEFRCLAITIEQPFTDDANHPEPDMGWSPSRCRDLGAALLGALDAVADDLADFRPMVARIDSEV